MYQCPQGHYYNFMVNNLGAGQSAVNVEAFKNQYIKLLIDEYYSNRSCTTFSVDQLTVNKSIREPWLITMPLEKGKYLLKMASIHKNELLSPKGPHDGDLLLNMFYWQ